MLVRDIKGVTEENSAMNYTRSSKIIKLFLASIRPILKHLLPAGLVKFYIASAWKTAKDQEKWPPPDLPEKQGIAKYEYSMFSQNGEDGILRHLFSQIGFGSRLFLEFGFGPTENNSFRLVWTENFAGTYMDGSEDTVRFFNAATRSCGIINVRAKSVFLDLDNLNISVGESGLSGEIDLLTIDVDGNDYWFWKGLNCVSARIAVIEYNAAFGPELSVSVPYNSHFDRYREHPSGLYHGASLTALVTLGREKGYSLVGCDSNGVNAFFVRSDCLTKDVNVLSPQEAFRPHKKRLERGFSIDEQYSIIKNLPLITIE